MRPIALSIVALGCSEYDLSEAAGSVPWAAPEVAVDPALLDFGALPTGASAVQTFTVGNLGDAPLDVTGLSVASGLAFALEDPAVPFAIDPGAEREVGVRFTADGSADHLGQIQVTSNDPARPEVTVDLVGYGEVPILEIEPASFVFEDGIPCGGSVDLTIRNVGLADAVITDLTYASGGLLTFDDNGFADSLPITSPPGAEGVVTVVLEATTAGSDLGVLSIDSNDPRGIVTADQNIEGSFTDPRTEVFTEPNGGGVDVMFLVDQSCSMADDNKADVRQGIPGFVAQLETVGDWQMLEVNTDNGCGIGGILDSSTPNLEQQLIDNAFPNPNGSAHYLNEALLKLASLALTKTDPGKCNEGFGRPGAMLHVIVLSDEDEQSGRSHTHWLDEYGAFTGSLDLVTVSAIADLNTTCGSGGPGGYLDAAVATGGAVLDICSPDWGQQLPDLGSQIAATTSYLLSEEPIEGSVVVTVNGVITHDFTVIGPSISISSPEIVDGDVVEIRYDAQPVCE